jgi:TolA-binding protein
MREASGDQLQEFITKIASLYYHQRQKFLIGVGAFIAVIAIIVIVFSTHGKENPEVQLRFTEGLGLYSTNNIDQAEEKFVDFTRRYSSNYLAAKAHFYLGDIYFQKQDYQKAQGEFERAYKKLKGNPVLGPSTLFGIGNCYEEMQNLKKAAEIYENVYNKYKKTAIGTEALLASGRCYRNLNNIAKAEMIYQKAVKELPPGQGVETAKAELAGIQALKGKF